MCNADRASRFETVALLRVPDHSDRALRDYNRVITELTASPLRFYGEDVADSFIRLEHAPASEMPREKARLLQIPVANATDAFRFAVKLDLSSLSRVADRKLSREEEEVDHDSAV